MGALDVERPGVTRWVVAYDIPDDRRRGRVARELEMWGVRVQQSVFEVVAGTAAMDRMKERLKRLCLPEEDSLRLYPVCGDCSGRILRMGLRDAPAFASPETLVV